MHTAMRRQDHEAVLRAPIDVCIVLGAHIHQSGAALGTVEGEAGVSHPHCPYFVPIRKQSSVLLVWLVKAKGRDFSEQFR